MQNEELQRARGPRIDAYDLHPVDHHRELAQIVPSSVEDVRCANGDLPPLERECREQRENKKDGSHGT